MPGVFILDDLTKIILYTFAAGLCIPLGGVLANIEKIRPRWLENELRHAVIAFGGGILVAAVALVLVPEGTKYVHNAFFSASTLLIGGIFFFAVERYLAARKMERPQFIAMLLDYIPESLALGGAFAVGASSAPLLALFIGLQNIPEGFNAFREFRKSGHFNRFQILRFMFLLVPIGPVLAIFGWIYLSQQEFILGIIMLFASGGILYLIFQDIAPQSHLERHWAPPLGAVLGFTIGMLGNNLIGL